MSWAFSTTCRITSSKFSLLLTRVHSSRMRTGRSLTVCRGGLDLIPLNFPLGCGPGPDPPQFPPWVWAWRGVPPFLGGSPWQEGSSFLRGSSFFGGVLLPGASFLGGVSLVGGASLLRGSPWQGGFLGQGGCLLLWEVAVSQHALRQNPPCGQNHRHE